ncbi:hypothetical protein OHA63_17770 [Streptomyces anulatus]|uniref:hypothetical protein n=1 Tax=Streptomyces anulatus TaxID=1892 RepID=UPI002E3749BE|nr:hypothetical protein [Streptomyces anulatus]
MKPLKRPVRRGILVAHVAVSVSWLGLTVGLLTLGITAFISGDPATANAATRSMKIFGDWLVVPVALLALVSGLVLSLGTRRGRRLRISASSAKSVDARSPRQTA